MLKDDLLRRKIFQKFEKELESIRSTAENLGAAAPEICPVRAHPQAYFEVHAENY